MVLRMEPGFFREVSRNLEIICYIIVYFNILLVVNSKIQAIGIYPVLGRVLLCWFTLYCVNSMFESCRRITLMGEKRKTWFINYLIYYYLVVLHGSMTFIYSCYSHFIYTLFIKSYLFVSQGSMTSISSCYSHFIIYIYL